MSGITPHWTLQALQGRADEGRAAGRERVDEDPGVRAADSRDGAAPAGAPRVRRAARPVPSPSSAPDAPRARSARKGRERRRESPEPLGLSRFRAHNWL